ncbi:RICIN domain-containing protein [Gynuella sunshinyii]|uniref:Ricin B lectin domain-containing protein n=1 Tax=Gynuella sunshinyii YC6258 TaxID=1445510 RepID=A0A0C5VQX8_9GAMM|nr:RICIN domain-containing protein [Gynuella sunshinyii]AJQ95793.1 hypothetical Protein YC6258_03757 [Gynuella sunshinyii YC6258]
MNETTALLPSSLSRLIATSALAITATVAAIPSIADTSDFRGMNWARLGDNFTSDQLVLQGLNINDSYSTIYTKASAIYGDMSSTMGINTVRLPVNPATVSDTTWWSNYRATIDAATNRGFKVILTYWEDGSNSGGKVSDMSTWNTMWSTIVNTYAGNNLVYFEPMNEPHGYSSSQWRDIAADWLNSYNSAPINRVLIDGVGYAQDVTDICNDSRFDGSLLSLHHYAFFYGENDYWGWRNHFEARQSSCYDRVVVTEFGAPMDTGLNYMATEYSDNFIAHIRAVTGSMHDRKIGSVYWPAAGGKITDGRGDYDYYSMFAISGTNSDMCLSARNVSGAQRVMFGWGDTNPTVTDGCDDNSGIISGKAYYIQNRNSGMCLRTLNGSTADATSIVQYSCGTDDVEKWIVSTIGNNQYTIVQAASGKSADINGASTENGANNIIWPRNSGNNQKWRIEPQGNGYVHIVNVNSGLLLDINGASTADNGNNIQWPENGGANQDWTFIVAD